MAFLDQAFEINELPESSGGDFEPIPAGWYTAAIAGAELCDTKAGNGQYIKLRFDITGPSHQGRVVFTNLNIRNPNPKAQEIGLSQLGDIMRAAGLAKVQDTDELFGVNLMIKVAVKNDPQYGASNEVKAYKAIDGSAAPAPTQQAQQQSGGGGLPWQK